MLRTQIDHTANAPRLKARQRRKEKPDREHGVSRRILERSLNTIKPEAALEHDWNFALQRFWDDTIKKSFDVFEFDIGTLIPYISEGDGVDPIEKLCSEVG